MDNVTELQKPPFDKPVSFMKLFDSKTKASLIEAIKEVKRNAEDIA